MAVAILITIALGLVSVLLHYEVLQRVGRLRQRLLLSGRLELLLLVFAAVLAHVTMISLYAAAFA